MINLKELAADPDSATPAMITALCDALEKAMDALKYIHNRQYTGAEFVASEALKELREVICE
jgi:hypothetical protein